MFVLVALASGGLYALAVCIKHQSDFRTKVPLLAVTIGDNAGGKTLDLYGKSNRVGSDNEYIMDYPTRKNIVLGGLGGTHFHVVSLGGGNFIVKIHYVSDVKGDSRAVDRTFPVFAAAPDASWAYYDATRRGESRTWSHRPDAAHWTQLDDHLFAYAYKTPLLVSP